LKNGRPQIGPGLKIAWEAAIEAFFGRFWTVGRGLAGLVFSGFADIFVIDKSLGPVQDGGAS